jgi:predicted nucleic acid-binding protein
MSPTLSREPEDDGISPILVDSCIWGIALRKQKLSASQVLHVETLSDLIINGRVEMIGPIRQEVLSGISDPQQYERLRQALEPFPSTPILDTDYEVAAYISNRCRKRGFQGGSIDFLICAVASRCQLPIYTVDRDFMRYMAVYPEFDLFSAGSTHWD